MKHYFSYGKSFENSSNKGYNGEQQVLEEDGVSQKKNDDGKFIVNVLIPSFVCIAIYINYTKTKTIIFIAMFNLFY